MDQKIDQNIGRKIVSLIHLIIKFIINNLFKGTLRSFENHWRRRIRHCLFMC
jgi:hypothetical protein